GARTVQPVRRGILGRLAAARNEECADAPDGAAELETTTDEDRTGRTGEQESESIIMEMENERTARTGQPDWTEELFTSERTLRTPQLSLRVTEEDKEEEKNVYTHKG